MNNIRLYFKYILLYWLYLEPYFQKAGELAVNYMQITRYTRMTHTKI